jgi:hypothetical protein
MALRIVWRNSTPSNCEDIPVERIANDEFGTVYEVCRPGMTSVFKVTYGRRFRGGGARKPATSVSLLEVVGLA